MVKIRKKRIICLQVQNTFLDHYNLLVVILTAQSLFSLFYFSLKGCQMTYLCYIILLLYNPCGNSRQKRKMSLNRFGLICLCRQRYLITMQRNIVTTHHNKLAHIRFHCDFFKKEKLEIYTFGNLSCLTARKIAECGKWLL